MATSQFLTTLPFNPTTDIEPSHPSQLEAPIAENPGLKIYTKAYPNFDSLKQVWNLNYQIITPIALIRLTTSTEVPLVIKYCAQKSISLTVRSGGYDLFGRALISDAVVLDIRELNSITFSSDKKSVTIGGGAQSGPLLSFLDSHSLITPTTLAGIVGHLGWAFMGRFGPLCYSFGLGVGQIIGARIWCLRQWLDQIAPLLPPPSYSSSRSFFASSVTGSSIDYLISFAKSIPTDVSWAVSGFFITDFLVGHVSSSFGLRELSLFIHALAPSTDENRIEELMAWTKRVCDGLKERGVVKPDYLAIMDGGVKGRIGKENFERLRQLKRRVDPENVFKYVPATFADI